MDKVYSLRSRDSETTIRVDAIVGFQANRAVYGNSYIVTLLLANTENVRLEFNDQRDYETLITNLRNLLST